MRGAWRIVLIGPRATIQVCWTPHLNSKTPHLNSKPSGIRFIGPHMYILLNIHVFIQCGTFISDSLHHYLSLMWVTHIYFPTFFFHSMWDLYLTLGTQQSPSQVSHPSIHLGICSPSNKNFFIHIYLHHRWHPPHQWDTTPDHHCHENFWLKEPIESFVKP